MRRPTKSPFRRPAMQTLERLHSELGGQILENREEAQRLAGQMLHVEAVIKMLDPTYNLRRISVKRRRPNPWFKRGTVYRRAVDVLRMATEPLTAREKVDQPGMDLIVNDGLPTQLFDPEIPTELRSKFQVVEAPDIEIPAGGGRIQ
jgi:hypothetical protein